MHHEIFGAARSTIIGFLDSSWISAEYNDTATVRPIKNVSEYQKYTACIVIGIGLKQELKKFQSNQRNFSQIQQVSTKNQLIRQNIWNTR